MSEALGLVNARSAIIPGKSRFLGNAQILASIRPDRGADTETRRRKRLDPSSAQLALNARAGRLARRRPAYGHALHAAV